LIALIPHTTRDCVANKTHVAKPRADYKHIQKARPLKHHTYMNSRCIDSSHSTHARVVALTPVIQHTHAHDCVANKARVAKPRAHYKHIHKRARIKKTAHADNSAALTPLIPHTHTRPRRKQRPRREMARPLQIHSQKLAHQKPQCIKSCRIDCAHSTHARETASNKPRVAKHYKFIQKARASKKPHMYKIFLR